MTSTDIFDSMTIEEGSMHDYARLARFHYRSDRPATVSRIFRISMREPPAGDPILSPRATSRAALGVIIISRPHLGCAMRNVALNGRYRGLDRKSAARLINEEVRTISRVIVDPRCRGLGLAVRLVRHALGRAETVYTEGVAAMGRVHPFFEKAGMLRFDPPLSREQARFESALDEIACPPHALASVKAMRARIDGIESEEYARGSCLNCDDSPAPAAGAIRAAPMRSRSTRRSALRDRDSGRGRCISFTAGRTARSGPLFRNIAAPPRGAGRPEHPFPSSPDTNRTGPRESSHMVQHLPLDQLHPHPANANVMPNRLFRTLVQHLREFRRHPPLIVRPHPRRAGAFEILDGHHRARALREVGETRAACEVWEDVDDERAAILLLTLNRLQGSDDPKKRAALIDSLRDARTDAAASSIARRLPEDRRKIERLLKLARQPPPTPARPDPHERSGPQQPPLQPVTFFLTPDQVRALNARLRAADARRRSDALIETLELQ